MTLNECDRLFAAVRSASTLAEACYALAPIIEAYDLLEVGLPRSKVYWRARLCGEEPWHSLSAMLYPPRERTPVGRLNDERSPMFYAATHEDTALAEIEVSEGAYVQVSGFKIRGGDELRVTSLGEFAHVYKAGYMRTLGTDPGDVVSRLIRDNSVDRARELLYIDSFLSSVLGDQRAAETQYRLTRALASMILRDIETEGLLYPSVRDTAGMNIALKPGSTDRKLSPVLCYHARIGKVRSFGFVDRAILSEATGISESGEIAWRRHTSSGRYLLFNMTKAEFERAMERERGASAGR